MASARNFSIIAHIDSGKSTLADRFLEMTKSILPSKMKPQFLDMMDLERERGITIKLQPVRMMYQQNGLNFILNLVDTPGHVDFSYEVSRGLGAVEGAILLVDATKGVQAQTIANLELARRQNLVIIPVINKIDLPQARIEEAEKEIKELLKLNPAEIIKISAKYGTNMDQLFSAIISRVPEPICNSKKSFRALIFDSFYDVYKGVVAYVRVQDGEIRPGEQIMLFATNTRAQAREIGFFKPEFSPAPLLSCGEIGYIATGVKEPGKVRVGDTVMKIEPGKTLPEPLPGYREPAPMVFASLYSENPDDFDLLKDSLAKLKLSDPSLIFEPETKEFLGRGFRCGFLGTLHAEIVSARLSREFGLKLIISAPSVVYRIVDKREKAHLVWTPSDWLAESQIKAIQEPWVFLEIITPSQYMGGVMDLLKTLQGIYSETHYLGPDKAMIRYEVPLRLLISNFYDKLKNVSQGYASMSYEQLEYRSADLVKIEILIAGKKEEAFSKISAKKDAYAEGKNLVSKLAETMPSQQFALALQAQVQGRIIARETLSARRKDVTDYLYGGDYTRKRKLLEKQKKGKKQLKEKGRVNIPSKVFIEMFRV